MFLLAWLHPEERVSCKEFHVRIGVVGVAKADQDAADAQLAVFGIFEPLDAAAEVYKGLIVFHVRSLVAQGDIETAVDGAVGHTVSQHQQPNVSLCTNVDAPGQHLFPWPALGHANRAPGAP